MLFVTPNFAPAIAEIFMLSMICLTLLADLFFKNRYRSISYYYTQIALIGAAVLTMRYFPAVKIVTFNGMFVQDGIAAVLKLFIYLTSFCAFWYAHHYIEERNIARGEYNLLGLFCVLGMMILVSANSLLTIYLGLELVALPLYAMVALRRDNYQATEAGLKYFIMGSIASGMLLYGLSMLYGATGSLEINRIAQVIQLSSAPHHLMFGFALVFIILGLAFKIAAAPFHMWAPDVYQGAPTSVTLFLSSAPKIAAFGMFIRLLIEALAGLHPQWQQLLIVLAIASMLIGNFIAIMQSNIKRMLAYSAIAHAGYMLLGLLTGTAEGYASAMFYILAYAIMSVGAFGTIILLSHAGFEAENIEDFKGLSTRNPWLAFMMLIILFSLSGIPPTVGFFAKFGVLKALVHSGLSWLAVVAMLFAVVGVFYYLRVITVMYFRQATDTTRIIYSADRQILISINGLALLALGLFPSTLMTLCRSVFGII